MDAEVYETLRAPFRAEQIGQIPKGGIQIDYVGHAHVTDRLLAVDPDWTWEPMGRTPEGLPALDQFGNLWINLTIGGVTRPGVGDGKSMKECVGDAIRNAAMRFGVALDLWAKGDANFGLAGHDAPDREQTPAALLRTQVMTAAKPRFTSKEAFEADFESVTGVPFRKAQTDTLQEYLAHLDLDAPAPQADTPPPSLDGVDTPAGQDWADTIRDRILAGPPDGQKVKAWFNHQKVEAGLHKVLGAIVALPDGEACTLEKLIDTRMREAVAA